MMSAAMLSSGIHKVKFIFSIVLIISVCDSARPNLLSNRRRATAFLGQSEGSNCELHLSYVGSALRLVFKT